MKGFRFTGLFKAAINEETKNQEMISSGLSTKENRIEVQSTLPVTKQNSELPHVDLRK